MKHLLALTILLAGIFSGCRRHSEEWETLCAVEDYIEERPDSAMSVLKRIVPDLLRNNEEKAKHALLSSMALDKLYIDTTDFSVLQPAIDYYRRHGSPTDKMRTRFYQGRIYENRKEYGIALPYYLDALEKGNASEEILTKARTLFAMGGIYNSINQWDKYIEVNLEAAKYFRMKHLWNSVANCLIRAINGCTLKGDDQRARKYIAECRLLLDSISVTRKSAYYSNNLTHVNKYGTKEETDQVKEEYLRAIPEERLDWLSLAYAYQKTGDYANACKAIKHYSAAKSADTSQTLRYYAILSSILEETKQYKEALNVYHDFHSLSDSLDFITIGQGTQFAEEKYRLALQTLKEQERGKRVLLCGLLALSLLLAILVWLRVRLRIRTMEKKLAEQRAEEYESACRQMKEEQESLKKLLAENEDIIEPDAKEEVTKRLALIDRFFVAYITNSRAMDKVIEEMTGLVKNKDTFINSMRLAYAGSHPRFIRHLEEKGLTEKEIGCCCLYALGLNGKEVGNYTNQKPGYHYNFSSEIRKKLGIPSHGTKLSTFLRQQLEELK